MSNLSRKDFLKLGATVLGAALLPDILKKVLTEKNGEVKIDRIGRKDVDDLLSSVSGGSESIKLPTVVTVNLDLGDDAIGYANEHIELRHNYPDKTDILVDEYVHTSYEIEQSRHASEVALRNGGDPFDGDIPEGAKVGMIDIIGGAIRESFSSGEGHARCTYLVFLPVNGDGKVIIPQDAVTGELVLTMGIIHNRFSNLDELSDVNASMGDCVEKYKEGYEPEQITFYRIRPNKSTC